MNIEQLKKEYNRLLVTFNKASLYMDNKSIPNTEKDKHEPRFREAIKFLNNILYEITQCGIKVTSDEILNGFKEVNKE